MHSGEVDTTAAPSPAAEEPPSRRSRRRWIIAIVGVLVLGVAIAFERIVLSAQPLEAGGAFGSRGEHRTIQAPGQDDAKIYWYRAGAEFRYEFNIANTGLLPVRVVDVPEPRSMYYAGRTALEVGDGGENELHGGSPDKFVRFTPFTLEPGQYRYLRLSHRFRDCDTAAIPDDHPPELFHSGTSWDQQELRFEILGFDRTVDLPLLSTIGLEGTGGECDGQPS